VTDNADHLLSLVDDIYGCVLDGPRWAAVLERVGGVLRACNGQIVSAGEQGLAFAYAWGTSAEVRERYNRAYRMIDPMTTLHWHCEVGVPVTTDQFIPRRELEATRFHREFLQPLGWHDFVITVLQKSAEAATMIGFTRGAGEPPFGPDDIRLMQRLAPHFRRAALLHGLLEGARGTADTLTALFEAVAAPIFLLDAGGRCVGTNPAARQLLARPGSIVLRDGALDSPTGQLAAHIRRALAPLPTPPAEPRDEDLAFGFEDAEARRHVAQILPLRRPAAAPDRAVAAMLVQEVGALRPLPGAALVELYGLTPAETRLLQLLAQGRSLEDSANLLGIAITTARTHLRRLFAKTDTRRQTQLVRLVLAALPMPPA